MLFLIKLCWVALLTMVAYQDYRYRAVSWIIFPMLACAFGGYNLLQVPLTDWLRSLFINLSFIGTQLLLLVIYFSMKAKKMVNISAGYLGLGDILFLLSVCFLLSPAYCILFYVVSLVLALMLAFLSKQFGYTRYNKIPLAGLQANLLALLVLFDWACNCFGFNDDTWFFKYLI